MFSLFPEPMIVIYGSILLMQSFCPFGALSIPPGKGSVNKGLKEAKEKSIDTVFLEPGTHTIKGDYVVIDRPMQIIGMPGWTCRAKHIHISPRR